MPSALQAFIDWQANRFDELARHAVALKNQISDAIKLREQQLHVPLDHDHDINDLLKTLEGLDTSSALTFRTSYGRKSFSASISTTWASGWEG